MGRAGKGSDGGLKGRDKGALRFARRRGSGQQAEAKAADARAMVARAAEARAM